MSTGSIEWERFRRAYAADGGMQQQLDVRLTGVDEAVVAQEVSAFARERGYEVSPDEAGLLLADASVKDDGHELSDDELAHVSGGHGSPSARLVPSQVRIVLLAP